MQERQFPPFDSETPTLTERRARRRLRLRRLSGLALGVGAAVLALFAIGCPEPADLQNAGAYPAPGGNTAGSATAGSATGGSATAGSATAGSATGGSGMVGGGAECESACLKALIADTCKTCHGKALKLAGTLDMESDGLTARLKNKPAEHPTPGTGAMCPTGDKLIDTMTPANSWLLKKVSGQQGTCGAAMPSPALAGDDLTCFQTYVACVAGGT